MAKTLPVSVLNTKKRDFSGLGLIDYSLMSIGTALACWSAGMAIAQPQIGIFSASLVLAGTVFSYLMRILGRGRKWLMVDGVLYAAAGIGTFMFSASLQTLMPEGGFPRELFAAAWLSWMMIVGSFVTWRDSTLLFQAVPAIAMFGLVGCYDTFRDVRFAFFGFLICLATFFARAHARQMLKEAADSGYFSLGLAPGTPAPSPELTPGLMDRLREGPWRWAAGPEWAVASALVVVVISLLGAPVIRSSMEGVSGFVRVNSPRIRPTSTVPTFVASGTGESVAIGRGAITLTDTIVLEAHMNQPRYLRVGSYTRLLGRTWSREPPTTANYDQVAQVLSMMKDYETFPFTIKPKQRLRTVPTPGVVVAIGPASSTRLARDGAVDITTFQTSYQGTAAQPSAALQPSSAPNHPSPLFGNLLSTSVSAKVRGLTGQITKGLSTDYEKASAIKSAIEQRIQYSIEAPAVPSEVSDPVDYTLFESKLAYCDLFASSMVQMARAAGIPARYTTGYLVSPDRKAGEGVYVVQERDAHAWAELLFDDVGWVVFDATENAVSLDGEGVGATNNQPFFQRRWVVLTIDFAILALLATGAFFVIRGYLQKVRNPDYHSDLEEVYLGYTNALRKATGQRRGLGMTADEYLSEVGPQLGAASATAQHLNRDFVSAFYAPGVIDKSLVEAMRDKVQSFRRELRKTRSG